MLHLLCLLQEIWVSSGQNEAAARVRRAVRKGTLPSLAELGAGLDILQRRSRNKKTPVSTATYLVHDTTQMC